MAVTPRRLIPTRRYTLTVFVLPWVLLVWLGRLLWWAFSRGEELPAEGGRGLSIESERARLMWWTRPL
jgi:hypothetical protein